ncbi:MAG: AAA family ATPase [Candidatus Micrarchaeia archaeon]
MRVVGVVGRRGSGKGVFAEVAKRMGLPVFEMSDVVVERMLKTKIIIDNRSLRLFADRLRKRFGAGFVARRTIERIKKKAGKTGVAVVVGIRSPAEVREFRKAFGEFKLIAVSAPLPLRWARIRRRRRLEDARSFGEFVWAERMEESWGLGKALEMADARITNAGGKMAFKKRVREFLQRIVFYSPKA